MDELRVKKEKVQAGDPYLTLYQKMGVIHFTQPPSFLISVNSIHV